MTKSTDITAAVGRMAEQIAQHNIHNPLIIGIHTGGVWVAEKLIHAIESKEELGTLDISFYRDDFSRVGLNPQVRSSVFPTTVENRNIILIDDVLYTGRTIRAALNEIFSFGRPTSVTLGVLINRIGRELPIQPDFTGLELKLNENQQAKLFKEGGTLTVKIIERPGK